MKFTTKRENRGTGKHTVIVVITNNHLLDLPKLTHLAPKVLVKCIEVVLQLTGIHLDLRIVRRILVKVWQQNGLRVGGLDVFSGTAITMSAGSDFVVERAVYFVGFGAKDGGEVVRHCPCLLVRCLSGQGTEA